jgi:nitrogen fixation/metabolism regulation signal transduction histidine kinase
LESAYQELRIVGEQLCTTVEAQHFLNQNLQTTHQTLQASYQELQQKTTFLESLFASLNIGVAVLDYHFTVLSWDRRAEPLWGIWA